MAEKVGKVVEVNPTVGPTHPWDTLYLLLRPLTLISTLEMSTLGAISSPGFIGSGVPSREDMADDGVVAVRSEALPPGVADTKAGGAVAHPAVVA